MGDARGFPAFPAGNRRRRRTWWGSEWIQVMEDAAVDTTLARRGRRIAGDGRLGPITISPGRVAAVLDGTCPIEVLVEPLSANSWASIVVGTTAGPGLTLTVYAAEPGSPADEALRLLASWAASQETEPESAARPRSG